MGVGSLLFFLVLVTRISRQELKAKTKANFSLGLAAGLALFLVDTVLKLFDTIALGSIGLKAWALWLATLALIGLIYLLVKYYNQNT